MDNGPLVFCRDNIPKCVVEAKAAFPPFADPIIKAFFDKYKLSFLPNMKSLVMAAKKIVSGKVGATCENLLQYIDELKFYGKQHIFLFTLKPDNAGYLTKIADPSFIQELLMKHGQEAAYNANICVLRSPSPFLSEVRYRYADGVPEKLLFKWIETRYYKELVGNTFKDREERSVNYFILNLINRTAQLRIQLLQSNPKKRLRAEYNIFIPEIMKFIDLNRFSAIPLEPIMKIFLFKSILPISSWRFKAMKGILEGTKIDQAYFSMLKLPLHKFFIHELSVYWNCHQDARKRGRDQLPFTLNGDNDSVTFKKISDKSKVDFILDVLRICNVHLSGYGKIAIKELRKLAKEEPLNYSLIYIIDHYFARMHKKGISDEELAREFGYEEEKEIIRGLFHRAALRYPNKFRIRTEGSNTVLTMDAFFFTRGLMDILLMRLPKFSAKKLGKKAIELSVLPLIGILKIAFSKAVGWLITTKFEDAIRIPLIVFELAFYALIILMFYSTGRIKNASIKTIFYVGNMFRKIFIALPLIGKMGRFAKRRLIALHLIREKSKLDENSISDESYLRWLKKVGLATDKQ